MQTIGYCIAGVAILIAGLFVGFWLFGIVVVCGLIAGGYFYFQNINAQKIQEQKEKQTKEEIKMEIDSLKKKAMEGIENLQPTTN